MKTPRLLTAGMTLLLGVLPTTAICAAEPLKVLFAISSDSRNNDFSQLREHLESNFNIEVTAVHGTARGGGFDKDGKTFPFRGESKDEVYRSEVPPLASADVILSNLYRTAPPPEQLASLKKSFRSKPIVGMRKAHHGFQNWLEADMEVFGVNYKGHRKGGNHRIAKGQEKNPTVAGFEPVEPDGGYYGHHDFADDVMPLLVMTPGGSGNETEASPQTWQRINKTTGQRVVYTRYGPDSLANEGVRDLVVRALFWAADKGENSYRK